MFICPIYGTSNQINSQAITPLLAQARIAYTDDMKHILLLLRSYYIDRYDPTLEQAQLAVQVACILLIAIAIGYGLHRPELLWLALPAALIALNNNGACRKQRYLTIIGATIATALGVFIASLLGQWLWATLALCFCVAAAGFYLTQYGQPIMMASVSTVILSAIAANRPCAWSLALERSLNIIIAGTLVIVIISLVFPYRPKQLLKRRMRILSYQLKRLSEATILGALCGSPQAYYRDQVKDYTLNNLQTCRNIIHRYQLEALRQQWRPLFGFYNILNSLCLLLSEPGQSSSFNQLSRYFYHINVVFCSCLHHLDKSPSPSMKQLCAIEQQLNTQAKTSNEDIASLAFLITRFRQRLEEYDAAVNQAQ